MYFSYGWPRSLVTGATAADSEAVYIAQGAGEYVVVVFNATIQVRGVRLDGHAAAVASKQLVVPVLQPAAAGSCNDSAPC